MTSLWEAFSANISFNLLLFSLFANLILFGNWQELKGILKCRERYIEKSDIDLAKLKQLAFLLREVRKLERDLPGRTKQRDGKEVWVWNSEGTKKLYYDLIEQHTLFIEKWSDEFKFHDEKYKPQTPWTNFRFVSVEEPKEE